MAITDVQVAAAMELGDGATALEEPILTLVGRYILVGKALVEKFAPDAPEVIRDQATIQLCKQLYDSPPAAAGLRFAYALEASGAAHLLSQWRVIRGWVVANAGDPSP